MLLIPHLTLFFWWRCSSDLRESFLFLLSHYLLLDLSTLLYCYANGTVTLKVKGRVILLGDHSSESKSLIYNFAHILNLKIASGKKNCCTLAVPSKLLRRLLRDALWQRPSFEMRENVEAALSTEWKRNDGGCDGEQPLRSPGHSLNSKSTQ